MDTPVYTPNRKCLSIPQGQISIFL